MSDHPPLAIYELAEGPHNASQWIVTFVRASGRLPVVFEGKTEAEAVEAAKAFWAANRAEHSDGAAPAKPINPARLAALELARSARRLKKQQASVQ